MVISKYDIRGFVSSLRVDAIEAVHEALVKHFISKLLKSIYGLGDPPGWADLFRSLLRKHKFLLIVLDDARYDVFMRVYKRYLRGSLIKARVPPPTMRLTY